MKFGIGIVHVMSVLPKCHSLHDSINPTIHSAGSFYPPRKIFAFDSLLRAKYLHWRGYSCYSQAHPQTQPEERK